MFNVKYFIFIPVHQSIGILQNQEPEHLNIYLITRAIVFLITFMGLTFDIFKFFCLNISIDMLIILILIGKLEAKVFMKMVHDRIFKNYLFIYLFLTVFLACGLQKLHNHNFIGKQPL